ncbi:sulfotransferase 1A1-like [Biomphalaria glabrata]|uniref:Sulfotransferase 1A1-like n=1 Tax=Biomphalaria glabrata TaxID=6526 RepID=A0A9W2YKT2_BIOGL|nr:sulfotransferase 1A1-like [Biomphalaria glabrata]
MPVEVVYDDHGDGMTLCRYHGDRFGASDFVEESLVSMRDVELREDDIMLCSYSKSGCHWMWEILRLLQAGTTDLEVVDKESHMMEYNTVEQIDALPSPRVLNNHMHWDMQPRDLVDKKIKTVFFYRNPKDVAVSFFNHHRKFKDYDYKGTFNNYLQRLVQGKVDNGSPFRYLREWEDAILRHPELPIFVGCYEDMKENPLSELKRLARFLGHDYSDDFLRQVMHMTTFESMKERKGPASFQDDNGRPIMYRKGQVGDWVNYFTYEQNKWFDKVIRQAMKGSRLKFRYTLDHSSGRGKSRSDTMFSVVRQSGQ